MSNVSKTTLKTYFVTGATPTEGQFGNFIDSSINVLDDVSSSLNTDSALKVLSSAGAKSLKDLLDAVDVRVVSLENEGTTFAANYYNKTEIDAQVASIGSTIGSLPYASQISSLTTRVSDNEASLLSKSLSGHAHAISDITSLQSSLDGKASEALLNATKADLINSINGKVSAGHTHVMADVTDLGDFDLSIYAKLTDLSGRASTTHEHSISDISNIGTVYYNKTEIDSKIEQVGGSHTHVESEISDLDKYTKGQTNLKILDHSGLTNNPHSVTKSQVNLGNVENLSSANLFTSTASTDYKSVIMSEVNALVDTSRGMLSIHEGLVNNPHSVTKSQVSLGNVPNIDVKALLDAHATAANPHNIDLSFFDVYAKAETDERVTLGLDSIRYAFKPTSPTDSAGSIGDLTWGSDSSGNFKAYLKVAEAGWRAFALFQEQSGGKVEFDYDTTIKESLVIDKNLTTTGDSTLGNLFISGSNISTSSGDLNFTSENGVIVMNDTLEVTNRVSLGSTLYVKSNSVFDGSIDVAECAQLSNVSICSSTIATTDSSLLNLPQGAKIGGNLEVIGNLTIQGTQTTLNTATLDVEDNVITLNSNVTGLPTTDAGIEVERGTGNNSKIYWDESEDLWKISSGGIVKTISSNEEFGEFKTSVSSQNNALVELINLRATIVSLGTVQNQIDTLRADMYSSANGT